MTEEYTYYFAYGSNACEKRLQKRLARDGERAYEKIPAVLRDKKLVFNKKSRQNPELGYPSFIDVDGEVLYGALYKVTMNGIYSLDSYEMYPHYYRRIMLEVETNDGKIVEAWVYMANPSKTAEGLKPSQEYLQFMIKSKDIFPEEVIEEFKALKTVD